MNFPFLLEESLIVKLKTCLLLLICFNQKLRTGNNIVLNIQINFFLKKKERDDLHITR